MRGTGLATRGYWNRLKLPGFAMLLEWVHGLEWRKRENSRSLMLQYGKTGNQKPDCCKEHADWWRMMIMMLAYELKSSVSFPSLVSWWIKKGYNTIQYNQWFVKCCYTTCPGAPINYKNESINKSDFKCHLKVLVSVMVRKWGSRRSVPQ